MKGLCIGGVDPDSLSDALMLDAFKKGPCGPAILSYLFSNWYLLNDTIY